MMPKKRRQITQYTKPQSTPPPSLSSSRDRDAQNDAQHIPSVNELLADLRRVQLSSAQQHDQGQQTAFAVAQVSAPSVPPSIRHILQLPETPAPRPRRPVRIDPTTGRRLPPGPAPPRSWLSMPASAQAGNGASGAGGMLRQEFQWRPLAGGYAPERGSLIDTVLRKIAWDWDFQSSYNRYHLYLVPSHLKAALIVYLNQYYPGGISLAILKSLLLPPLDENLMDGGSTASPISVSEDVWQLDLSGSLGRSIGLRELLDFLFLFRSQAETATGGDLQDSWDVPETKPIPRPLLPNLTHLSLAIRPDSASAVSWKQLLSFAAHLPKLTHLSLAYWPEPTLTRNTKFATVARPLGGGAIDYSRFGPLRHALQRDTFQYGGTGPYSHSLDGDWSEAVLVLRKLSKSLYGLEYLDLTGCSSWFQALLEKVEKNSIDWVGDWGKVTTLILQNGYRLGDQAGRSEREKYKKSIDTARRIESHITARRAGRGRWITVERDTDPNADI